MLASLAQWVSAGASDMQLLMERLVGGETWAPASTTDRVGSSAVELIRLMHVSGL